MNFGINPIRILIWEVEIRGKITSGGISIIFSTLYKTLYMYTILSYNFLYLYEYLPLSDPTLTTHNVVEMMKGVEYGYLRLVLTASRSKWIEIGDQYQSDEQRSEALIAHTISTHPCMSWSKLARGLQRWGHREAAAEVTRKYVKGKTRNTHAQWASHKIYDMHLRRGRPSCVYVCACQLTTFLIVTDTYIHTYIMRIDPLFRASC